MSGMEQTRVFRDVAEVGGLKRVDPVLGTTVEAEVALLFDWENRWALEEAMGPRQEKKYEETCHRHYFPFWSRGVPVDVINADQDFSRYRLLVAPMLYMVRPGVGERLADFVAKGGTLVATYWSGIVDENDLCFLGGVPGPLRKTLGIWVEEIDALYDGEVNYVSMLDGNALGLKGEYKARNYVMCFIWAASRLRSTRRTIMPDARPLPLTVSVKGKLIIWLPGMRIVFLATFITV